MDLLDPVFTFDRFMEGIDLKKYLKNVPEHITGRLRYNPVNMLKTVLFGFMTNGYCSLRELEDNCKVNLRFMYLMDHQAPSYRRFGYFINEILQDPIEEIFSDINHAIFEEEDVGLQHLYIDGSKFEANANKYTWVWKKATERSCYRLYEKITALIEQINQDLSWSGIKISTNTEYVPEYLDEVISQYAMLWKLDEETFVHGKGKHKTMQQRQYELLQNYTNKLKEYVEKMERFRDTYGFYPKYPVADAGYGSYNNYLYCEQNGMEKYMKFPMFKKETTDKKYHNDPFRAVNFRINENGEMRCPNGKAFRFQYRKAIRGNRTVRINEELTRMHQEVMENLESIQEALLRMNRSIQAEGTFGIMKHDHWYKRIVRIGKKAVQLEILLVCIGHNLNKYHTKKMRIQKAA